MMLRNFAVLGLVALASTYVDADGHVQGCKDAKAHIAKHCSDAGEAGEAGGDRRRRDGHDGKDHGFSGATCDEMKKGAKLVCDVVEAEAAVKAQVEVMTKAAAAFEAAAKAGTCTARLRRDGHGGKDHGESGEAGESGESDEDGHAAMKAMCGLRMRRDGHAKADACARRMRKDGHAAAKSCDCLKQEVCDAYVKVGSLTAAFHAVAKALEAAGQEKRDEDDGFPKEDPPDCTKTCPVAPKSCEDVKKMIAEGGCAHSCSDKFKAEVKEFMKCPPKAPSASGKALAAFDKACPATTAAPGRSRRDAHAAKLCPGKARRDAHAKDACAGSRMRKDGHSKAEKSCDCLKQEFCAAKTAAAADAPPATTTAAPTAAPTANATANATEAATTEPAAKAPGATTTAAEESSAFQMASSVAATFAAVGAAMVF